MYLIINIIGIIVFIAISFMFSKNKATIHWKSIIILLIINLALSWFLTEFSVGRSIVHGAADGFVALVNIAYEGIAFALPDWVHVKQMNFVTSVLLPILMIVPLFDILTYIGILPFIIKWVGTGLSKITGQPKFESFFSMEMMFLGNTEAIIVSKLQLNKISKERTLTIAMMSMSCVTASIVGAYITMMPGEFVLTAIPINIINALLISNILNPVSVTSQEDTVVKLGENPQFEDNVLTSENNPPHHKEPFFSFLGDSILNSGKLILIVTANVIAFVALAALVNKILGLVNPWLSLEHILGLVMFPFSWLMGLNVHDSFEFAQYMGTKLVTNEFVVMGQVSDLVKNLTPHYQAVLTVFLTSFANFSTLGMIIGCLKTVVNKEKNEFIAQNVGYLILSGILVSLMSAGTIGLFVW